MPSEINLAPANALQDGEMRAYPATPDTEVLLVRRQGQYRALAARCPHYGAPLEKGRIINDQIICPWHHACFRVDDGHLCQPPALDDLPTYPVRVADGRIWVTLPANPAATAEGPDATPTALVGGTPLPTSSAPPDKRTFVIVGGGAAGQFAAQTLRAEGFGGRLVMVSADPDAPYDRTKLSKAFLAGKADKKALPLRQPNFYEQHQIELLTATRATGLSLQQRQLHLEGRGPLAYDKLLLAPGSRPNTLPQLPGHDLNGVLPLRTAQDAEAIRKAAANAKQVVIIGSSFIGMEAAASLATENEEQKMERVVTVIARDKEPFKKVLGAEIGAMFRHMHTAHGVQFEAEADVASLEGKDGRVTAVRLASGQHLPADLVVLGVGVRPATEFLAEAFEVDKDGGLTVDAHLQAAENVYVAGDVARFPLMGGPEQHRIEHWRLAQQQGACAARNMLGQQETFAEIPFFWTQQFGKSLRYAGHAAEWDEIIFHGQLEEQNFLALYVHDNRLMAAAAMGRDDDMLVIMELLRRDQMPTPAAARGKIEWAKLLAG